MADIPRDASKLTVSEAITLLSDCPQGALIKQLGCGCYKNVSNLKYNEEHNTVVLFEENP